MYFDIDVRQVKPTDSISLKFDLDIFDIDEISEIFNLIKKVFPQNTVYCCFKGMDIKFNEKETTL